MKFEYDMPKEKYNMLETIKHTGDYKGPEKVEVRVDDNGLIDASAQNIVELDMNNPNHILLMDIMEGSTWFDYDNTPTVIESVGPYINLKKETLFSPKSVYEINEFKIIDNVVYYTDILFPSSRNIILKQAKELKESAIIDLQLITNTVAKSKYVKLIHILDWILFEWDELIIPSYKIVIPTIDTIDVFNDIII